MSLQMLPSVTWLLNGWACVSQGNVSLNTNGTNNVNGKLVLSS